MTPIPLHKPIDGIMLYPFVKKLPAGQYRRGEIVRYRVNDATHTGTIIWVAAPRESQVQGHGVVPTRYVVVRQGWSGFPDVIYSSDILTS